MPKKIRVYELARELGLTNKEALDLCLSLGIGVKSHSSSIEDAQADRARRKADREGLRREVQPEEPAKKGAAKAEKEEAEPATAEATAPSAEGDGGKAAAAISPAGKSTADEVLPAPEIDLQPAAAGRTPAGGDAPVAPAADHGIRREAHPIAPAASVSEAHPRSDRLIVSRPASEVGEGGRSSARPAGPPPRSTTTSRPIPPAPTHGAPGGHAATGGHAVPGGRGTSGEAATAAAPGATTAARPAPGGTDAQVQRPHSDPAGHAAPAAPGHAAPAAPAHAGPASPAGPVASASGTAHPRTEGPPRRMPQRPLLGPSGKPIPPPPGGPPRSLSGKPIPPPPGGGPRTAGGSAPAHGRPLGGPRRDGPRPMGGGAPRGGPGTGGPRPGGGPGGPRPSFGSDRPGGPGRGGPGAGGPGGPPGGGGMRGGPGGRGRIPHRRPQRRRRNVEELEPIQITTYTPSNAPVPDAEVIIERGTTAQQLGPKLNRSAGDVIRFLLLQGEMVTATQSLTDDMIELFAAEIGARVRLVDVGEEQEAALQNKYFGEDDAEAEDPAQLRTRPPVITVMGHVDHGKTLLLDRIRSSNVIAGEAGGITQHIGAYQVDWEGHLLTFIDTPGHEAFTAMRARGAEVTDIVVLVVAADDGVMPQTAEAIDHAKAAGVPIVVAINKIDRDDADPNRVMQQLSEHGLVPETWGGDTIMVEVSALQSAGIDELLGQLVVLAEVQELKANPEGRARGTVLEANLDIGRGPVATVIVQSGTLRVGDAIVAGPAWGKVKALIDDRGDNVKEALPSMPVEVLGLSEPPSAGDALRGTIDLATSRTIGEVREQRMRFAGYAHSASGAVASGAKLEDIFEQIQRGETATLTIVLKADVQGSLEAVTESLRRLERDEVKISFVRRAVGGITESDVELAAASNSTIIGFNVRPDRRGRELAEAQGVEIRTYEIIYRLVEDIQSAMVGMLAPTFEEIVTGDAEVRAIFRVPKIGAIAGCWVLNGTITRGSKVRFIREGVVIWKGAISSLRRFKDDVREVQSGFECGIGLTDYQDLRDGDIIETYEEREVART